MTYMNNINDPNQLSFIENYLQDLSISRHTPRFIEVEESEIERVLEDVGSSVQKNSVSETFCKIASKVYDVDKKKKLLEDSYTNVLLLKPQQTLVDLLDFYLKGHFKNRLIRNILVEGVALCVTKVTSSALEDYVSQGVEKSLDSVEKLLNEAASRVSALEVWTPIENFFSSRVGDVIEDATGGFVGSAGAHLNDNWDAVSKLHLTNKSKTALDEVFERINEAKTPNEAVNALLSMLITIGFEAPKLIVIEDPYSLDEASLKLISLIATFSKEIKYSALEQGGESLGKVAGHTGIGFVLLYANPTRQLNSTFVDAGLITRQSELKSLRQFCQRYEMLERLDSDIPTALINRHIFVGRKKELARLKELHAAVMNKTGVSHQSYLIQGEPGTGKSALARHFMNHQTKSFEYDPRVCTAEERDQNKNLLKRAHSQICLRLFNSPTVATQTTGLESLIESMAKEGIRLQDYLVSQSFFVRKLGVLKDDVSQSYETIKDAWKQGDYYKIGSESAHNVVHYTGWDGVQKIRDLSHDLKDIEHYADQLVVLLKESPKSGAQTDKKQLEFVRLMGVIAVLNKLTTKVIGHALPIQLYIDDLQWIDEDSAEFILTRVMPNYPVELIVTARGSDSLSRLKQLAQPGRINDFVFSITLLSLLGIQCDDIDLQLSLERSDLPNKSESIHAYLEYLKGSHPMSMEVIPAEGLKGMDHATLVELLHANVQATSDDEKLQLPAQLDALAKALIKHLSNQKTHKIADNEQVVTLFAIEAINMLGDARFSSESKLFESAQNGLQKASIVLAADQIEAVLDILFEKLKDKYKESYEAELGVEVGRYFNLASFAVLEERLLLLHGYFDQHGDAAVDSLIFSSLLGAPFQSDLVRYLVKSLTSLSIDDYPELAPILNHLKAQSGECLEERHYDVLETAYEILRRSQPSLYQYKHSLIELYLTIKFTTTMSERFKGMSESELDLALHVEGVVKEWLEEHGETLEENKRMMIIHNIIRWKFNLKPKAHFKEFNDSIIKISESIYEKDGFIPAFEFIEAENKLIMSKQKSLSGSPSNYLKLIEEYYMISWRVMQRYRFYDFFPKILGFVDSLYEGRVDEDILKLFEFSVDRLPINTDEHSYVYLNQLLNYLLAKDWSLVGKQDKSEFIEDLASLINKINKTPYYELLKQDVRNNFDELKDKIVPKTEDKIIPETEDNFKVDAVNNHKKPKSLDERINDNMDKADEVFNSGGFGSTYAEQRELLIGYLNDVQSILKIVNNEDKLSILNKIGKGVSIKFQRDFSIQTLSYPFKGIVKQYLKMLLEDNNIDTEIFINQQTSERILRRIRSSNPVKILNPYKQKTEVIVRLFENKKNAEAFEEITSLKAEKNSVKHIDAVQQARYILSMNSVIKALLSEQKYNEAVEMYEFQIQSVNEFILESVNEINFFYSIETGFDLFDYESSRPAKEKALQALFKFYDENKGNEHINHLGHSYEKYLMEIKEYFYFYGDQDGVNKVYELLMNNYREHFYNWKDFFHRENNLEIRFSYISLLEENAKNLRLKGNVEGFLLELEKAFLFLVEGYIKESKVTASMFVETHVLPVLSYYKNSQDFENICQNAINKLESENPSNSFVEMVDKIKHFMRKK